MSRNFQNTATAEPSPASTEHAINPPDMVQEQNSELHKTVPFREITLGYVTGHEEAPLGSIATLRACIENQNVSFQELNLYEGAATPAAIKIIFLNGPQRDFSDREMKLLSDFWGKQGRILFLRDPAAKTPKLDAFLNELGVKVNDDRLMAMVETGIQEVARVRDVLAHFLPDNPITSRLANVQAAFGGGTSSLTLKPPAPNIRVQPLIQAEKGYWGEVDYNSTEETKLRFDQTRDRGEPLTIAASIERGGGNGDDRVHMNSARMVVVSNATFVHDNAITSGRQALDFTSASINWLLH